ncbi:energy-coupling factor ABC transporter permease [Sorangium sp. So ce136]
MFLSAVFLATLLAARPAAAMHLAEGVLPLGWCAVWNALALPFVAIALHLLRQRTQRDAFYKPFVGLIAAAVFAISCMPVPVPTAGTCSHPCGTGLAAVLIGPWMTVLVTVVALLIQALFLAHGGLTTLGADVASMGIAGAFTGYLVFRLARRCGANLWVAGFLAGVTSDWATYATTALELALGLAGEGSVRSMFTGVAVAFIPTQLPLGLLEGAMTAGALVFLRARRPDILERLRVVPLAAGAS